jgi:hypothetical protein
MKHIAVTIFAAALLIFASAAAEARSAYDGSWNILFVTQRGTCDASYNFMVNVSNGVITHPNITHFRGYVTNRGFVRASVTVHEKHASGSGRLAMNYGQGTWSGYSGGSRCSGYWRAERG